MRRLEACSRTCPVRRPPPARAPRTRPRRSSERDVAVLSARVVLPLVREDAQRLGDAATRIFGTDHLIDEPELRGLVRTGEERAIVFGELFALGLGILGLRELAAEDDVDRTFGAHHRDLGRGIREVDVAADVL